MELINFLQPDFAYLLIMVASMFIVTMLVLKVLKEDPKKRDDDEDNGGGGVRLESDPVLDLPPGVSLPIDKTEPELVLQD